MISAKIHSANDASLAIDTFEFGEKPRFDISDPEQTACMERAVAFAAENHPEITEDEVRDFIQRCTADYIFSVSPLRFCQHLKIYRELSGTEGTIVRLEQEKDERYSRIVVAVMNASTRRMLERAPAAEGTPPIETQRTPPRKQERWRRYLARAWNGCYF